MTTLAAALHAPPASASMDLGVQNDDACLYTGWGAELARADSMRAGWVRLMVPDSWKSNATCSARSTRVPLESTFS